MIKNNERGMNQTTMNEKGGACSYPAGKFILSPVLFRPPLFIKNETRIVTSG
jgi:hypothetical protein